MRLKVDYGKGKRFDFTFLDESNEAINLTGLTGTFTANLDIPGDNGVAKISEAMTIVSATDGTAYIILDDTATVITPAIYLYQCTWVYDTADNRVLDSGTIQIIGDDTIRLNEIKAKYGLGFDYYTMKSALDFAHIQIPLNGFSNETGTNLYTDSNDIIPICNYVMDSNFDGTVDADDIEVYEYMSVSPYTTTDLSSNVSSVEFDHPTGRTYITMDDSYPTTGFTLEVKYARGAKKYSEALLTIEYLEELFVLKQLFSTMEINKLHRGITSRSINGVDISFDKTAIDEFIKTLNIWIYNETLKLKPFKECDLSGFSGSGSPLTRNILISKKY